MMMQPQAMMAPVNQPLIHQPISQPANPHYPSYAPVPTMAPVAMAAPVPVVAAPAPAAGPVQNNATSQSVVINQAGSNGAKVERLLVDPLGVRGWSTSLCGCLDDIASCACACFCSPLLLCRVSNRLKECAFISCAVPGGMTALRVKLRTMGGIRGSICQDCLVTHFCLLCAACQMSRELDAMGL